MLISFFHLYFFHICYTIANYVSLEPINDKNKNKNNNIARFCLGMLSHLLTCLHTCIIYIQHHMWIMDDIFAGAYTAKTS